MLVDLNPTTLLIACELVTDKEFWWTCDFSSFLGRCREILGVSYFFHLLLVSNHILSWKLSNFDHLIALVWSEFCSTITLDTTADTMMFLAALCNCRNSTVSILIFLWFLKCGNAILHTFWSTDDYILRQSRLVKLLVFPADLVNLGLLWKCWKLLVYIFLSELWTLRNRSFNWPLMS